MVTVDGNEKRSGCVIFMVTVSAFVREPLLFTEAVRPSDAPSVICAPDKLSVSNLVKFMGVCCMPVLFAVAPAASFTAASGTTSTTNKPWSPMLNCAGRVT